MKDGKTSSGQSLLPDRGTTGWSLAPLMPVTLGLGVRGPRDGTTGEEIPILDTTRAKSRKNHPIHWGTRRAATLLLCQSCEGK